MILDAAEFILRLSLGLKAGKDKSHAILRRSNNNTKVHCKTFKLMCYVLLYWLVPKRCVPLEAGHVFSNGDLVCVSLNSQMKIYIPRDLEHVCLCAWDGKSQRVMGTEWECVAEIHHSCSAYSGRHRGGSHRAEQNVCQFATAVALCTANWASPREQTTVCSRPIWDVAYLCQPCMTTSCVLDWLHK